MSNENETRTDVAETLPTDYDGHIMRTPDEWCRIKQIQILDADGWRGYDAKDWTEPLTELDFEERAQVCTQRSVAPQPAGEQHAGSLNLTGEGNEAEAVSPITEAMGMAAAEAMHVYDKNDPWNDEGCNDTGGGLHPSCREWTYGMAVAALEAAYPAIRQQVAEEIAVALDKCASSLHKTADNTRAQITDDGPRDDYNDDRLRRVALAHDNRADGLTGAAVVAREIGAKA